MRASLTILLVLSVPGLAAAADWPNLDPADRALTRPRVDTAADAEVLLWEVRIADETETGPRTVLTHYLRIKIFTERGREEHAKVDLTYTDEERIRDVEGRTVAPDGRITELRGEDVLDRTIVKTDGLRVRAKSFVLPSAVVGSIIEYRWREYRDTLAHYLELPFQRDLPVHVVRYTVLPLPVRELGYQMRTQNFNLAVPPAVKRTGNTYSLEMRDVPALKRERYMPPELGIKPWMLLYYADLATANLPADRFWQRFGKDAYDSYKPRLRATSELAAVAKAITAAAKTPNTQVDALVALIHDRIEHDELAARQRRSGRDDDAADTLRRGSGSHEDITVLFVALAAAAGLDARLVLACDRDYTVCFPNDKQPYFLSHTLAAVRIADRWRFVDPNNRYSHDGHVRWQQEGPPALLLDSEPSFVTIAPAPPAYSIKRRSAELTLSEQGALEGQVTLEYTGHFATQFRERNAGDSLADQQRRLTEEFARGIPGIEISDLTVSNVDDLQQPYTLRFKIRVASYGQRTGSRLFMQPAIMQRGVPPLFTESDRRHPIQLPFPSREEDTITVQLPREYELETNAAPAPINGGNAANYTPTVLIDEQGHRIRYVRTLISGADGAIFFPATSYAALKLVFGDIQTSDDFTLSLRRRTAAPNAQ